MGVLAPRVGALCCVLAHDTCPHDVNIGLICCCFYYVCNNTSNQLVSLPVFQFFNHHLIQFLQLLNLLRLFVNDAFLVIDDFHNLLGG